MSTKKQARAHAQREQRKYEARQAAKRAKREHRIRIVAAITAGALVLGAASTLIVMAVTNDDEVTTPEASDTTPSATASANPSADSELELTTGWATSPTPPDPSLAEDREWEATIATNLGDIAVTLDGVNAPQATASFVALAEDGYFDQTECHRLVTDGIYVLQCGDPSATGTGGPNYTYGPIENAPTDDVYPAGTLAMARRGGDAESMGSQFFIVYEDSTIPSDAAGGYTVFGQVTEGLSIVEGVANAGTITGEPDGQPAQSVIVNEVSVS
ncbi:peptidylprolyl isomerase [Demequina sp. NBRC 110051]|uniref:peptidylprolyl isomerase n=1 Tax=Demequina sp. NBRC 110051 TaxID=1570340 RepID=UPI000A0410F1|nr:peptidylprolyl isomerase [Demequina sp. NBRC 110051]